MSAWIKLEKTLETDPRVLRIARALAAAEHVTHERYSLAHHVTHVIGALARLWIFADSHARDDDSLDMTKGELDDWLGIPGFCALLPADWLDETDDGRLILPNFQEHNGTEARRRALGAKRVAEHRSRSKEVEKRTSVTPCNAQALPDQTRPDQTRPVQEARAKASQSASVPRETLDAARARETLAHESMAEFRKAYPPIVGRADWITTEKTARRLVDEGLATWTEIVEGAERYARFVKATGRLTLNPARFVGDADRPFLQAWDVPPSVAEKAPPSGEALSAWERLLSSDGAYRPPRVAKALDAAGGWLEVRNRNKFSELAIRAAFCRAFDAAPASAPATATA